MSLFLIGYMGSGKSSVAKRMSNRLGIDNIDMDTRIEEYAKASVEDIFAQSGEETFRTLENHILDKIIDSEEQAVVATGGGSPCHSGNMDKMLNAGLCVYLELSPVKLARRIAQSNRKNPGKRPLVDGLKGEELLQFVTEHLEERAPFYERADLTFNADKINSSVLNKIMEAYQRHSESR